MQLSLGVASGETDKDTELTALLHDAADIFRTECPGFVFEADQQFFRRYI